MLAVNARGMLLIDPKTNSLLQEYVAPLRDLLDAPTALAACCGFDLCQKCICICICIVCVFACTPTLLTFAQRLCTLCVFG